MDDVIRKLLDELINTGKPIHERIEIPKAKEKEDTVDDKGLKEMFDKWNKAWTAKEERNREYTRYILHENGRHEQVRFVTNIPQSITFGTTYVTIETKIGHGRYRVPAHKVYTDGA